MTSLNAASTVADWQIALVVTLVAFLCSHLLALFYAWSHRSLAYSQSFVQALVMASVTSALMMLVIGSNVVWGIGMVGALALVRFRTNLRDARDMIFVFMSLIVGLAAGTQSYAIAMLGTLVFGGITFYLSYMSFGVRNYFDALLRFTIPAQGPERLAVDSCLQQHCRRCDLATVQQVAQGESVEYVYQIEFRNPQARHEVVQGLERVPGLRNLSLMLEETRLDI